jgi:hypothetical protein
MNTGCNIYIYIYRITGNFCGVKFLLFWSKKKTFNFCWIFFSADWKSRHRKKIVCITGSNNWSDWNDKQLVLITVILRSKNIFSSLESFQKLQLLNTHLVNFKFVLRNFFFTILLTGNTKSTVGSISVQSVIYFGYIFFSVEFSYFIIWQLFKNNYD